MMNFFNKVKTMATEIVVQDPLVGKQLMVGSQAVIIGRQIASGSFAYVYETNSAEYVIKHMKIQTKEQLQEAVDEVHFQMQLNHHGNICKVYAAFINDTPMPLDTTFAQVSKNPLPLEFNIVLERCESSVLSLLNKQKGFLQEPQILQIFAGAVAGFTAQHNLQMINRDGKIENLLLKSGAGDPCKAGNIRICDFGSVTQKQYQDGTIFIKNATLRNQLEQEIQAKTTPQYRAPEMVDLYARMPITSKADVFALGVMLFRLMYKQLPFPDGQILANFNARYQFPDETEEYLRRNKYEEKDDVPIYPPRLKDLVRTLLTKDPAKRPSIFQVAQQLEQMIGKFGAEEENVRQVEVQERSSTAATPMSQPSQKTPAQVNLFDWQPVAAETTQSQQPSVVEQANPIPKSTPPAQTTDFLDFAPAQPMPAPAQPIQQPQQPAGGLSLFDWAPASDGPAPAPVVAQIPTTVKSPQAAPMVTPGPLLAKSPAPAAAAPDAWQAENDLLSWGAAPEQPQAKVQAPPQAPKQLAPQQQGLDGVDSLLNFEMPTPSVLETTPRVAPAQTQVVAPAKTSQFAAAGQAGNSFEKYAVGLTPSADRVDFEGDALVQHVRKTACAIFTPVGCTDAKLQERYMAMIAFCRAAVNKQLNAAQAGSLEQNLQLLVSQTQNSQAKNKDQVIMVLKDLCTLQQAAAALAKLGEGQFASGAFQITSGQVQIPGLTRLLQLVGVLAGLQKSSSQIDKYKEHLLASIVKPALKTCKHVCAFGSSVDAALINQAKDAYQKLCKVQEVFGIALPEVLELGDFE